jgi:hypothetical protein
MNNKQFLLPTHIVELDNALDKSITSAIPLIIKEIDREVRELLIGRVEELLRSRTYEGIDTGYLDGIRESIKVMKELD